MKRMFAVFVMAGMTQVSPSVPVDVYAVAKEDASFVSISRDGFEDLMTEVNAIFSQVAL